MSLIKKYILDFLVFCGNFLCYNYKRGKQRINNNDSLLRLLLLLLLLLLSSYYYCSNIILIASIIILKVPASKDWFYIKYIQVLILKFILREDKKYLSSD